MVILFNQIAKHDEIARTIIYNVAPRSAEADKSMPKAKREKKTP
jgi:hypothetical protein